MTGQSKAAIIASITIHVFAFIVLMGVKFYYGEVSVREKIPHGNKEPSEKCFRLYYSIFYDSLQSLGKKDEYT